MNSDYTWRIMSITGKPEELHIYISVEALRNYLEVNGESVNSTDFHFLIEGFIYSEYLNTNGVIKLTGQRNYLYKEPISAIEEYLTKTIGPNKTTVE